MKKFHSLDSIYAFGSPEGHPTKGTKARTDFQ